MERLPQSVKATKGFIVVCKGCKAKFIANPGDKEIKVLDEQVGYEAYLDCPECHKESGPLPPVPSYH